MAELEILRIEAGRVSKADVGTEFAAIGLTASDLNSILEEKAKVIGGFALKKLRSAVPIRKGELRRNLKLRSEGKAAHSVCVAGGLHMTSVTENKITNEELAHILEEGQHRARPYRNYAAYRRSRTSQKASPFESVEQGAPTANWASNAIEEFDQWLTTNPEVGD